MSLDYKVVTIPHAEHRYPTVGDWIFSPTNDLREIRVSDMANSDYEFLVALHEQVEAYLCLKRKITQESVDAFDIEYESKRPEGDTSEPGNDTRAPYYNEHQFATDLEYRMAKELGVDWEAYDKTIGDLP